MKHGSQTYHSEKVDYGFHYIKFNDRLVQEYLDSIKVLNPEYLSYNGYGIEGILEKRLFAKLIYDQKLRDIFNNYWKDGNMSIDLKNKFYTKAYGEFFLSPSETKKVKEETSSISNNFNKEKIKVALEPFKGKIVYYAYNLRFLEIAIPVLSKLKEEVIVLTYEDIPESFNCPDNILIIEFPVLKTKEFTNDFLELKFPILYYLFNNLEFLVKALEPKSILFFEGANVVEYNILAVIGKKFKICTICIQHGWPGLLYSGFHNMQFDYFLSWGDEFIKLLKPINPAPKFLTVGYPYEIPLKKHQEKDAVSFFFQGPYFVSTLMVIEQMIDFAIFCARTFPEFDILLREHPSSKIRTDKIKTLKSFKNIKFVPANEVLLKDVLARSIVSVSVFSSTLMESLVYNSIPLIFNLTSMPHYHPNLDEEKLGIEVKTLFDAQEKIVELLKSKSNLMRYRKNILRAHSNYYSSTGNEALQNTVDKIIKISNKK
ncbi:MAG: hypothetical protein ACOH2D_17310 [Gelidibacter sp.]